MVGRELFRIFFRAVKDALALLGEPAITSGMSETRPIPDDLESCRQQLHELAEAHRRLEEIYAGKRGRAGKSGRESFLEKTSGPFFFLTDKRPESVNRFADVRCCAIVSLDSGARATHLLPSVRVNSFSLNADDSRPRRIPPTALVESHIAPPPTANLWSGDYTVTNRPVVDPNEPVFNRIHAEWDPRRGTWEFVEDPGQRPVGEYAIFAR